VPTSGDASPSPSKSMTQSFRNKEEDAVSVVAYPSQGSPWPLITITRRVSCEGCFASCATSEFLEPVQLKYLSKQQLTLLARQLGALLGETLSRLDDLERNDTHERGHGE